MRIHVSKYFEIKGKLGGLDQEQLWTCPFICECTGISDTQ